MNKIKGKLLDFANRRIKNVEIIFDKQIKSISEISENPNNYILPGFIDSHVHIESSMLTPANFSVNAIKHGVIAAVTDPHEIANVLGIEGISYMIEDAKNTPMKIFFGLPSCVPATIFETSGASLNVKDYEILSQKYKFYVLSEMMNFPGVINNDSFVFDKINFAKENNLPIDGHAPLVSGENLHKYVNAGISTDHECSNLDEAVEKLNLGMFVQIREGSAAKDLEKLMPLFNNYSDKLMLCTDDCHPYELLNGYILERVNRILSNGYNIFDVLKAVTVNPITHYNLPVGLLNVGDPADFIISDSIEKINIVASYIDGRCVYDGNKILCKLENPKIVNNYFENKISIKDLQVEAKNPYIKVINAFDGSLLTKQSIEVLEVDKDNFFRVNLDKDILKIVVLNRYAKAKPQVAFIKGFGLKEGAIAGSIAHDSHNIIAIGAEDKSILEAINILHRNKGGITFVSDNEQDILPLPIAGLMSNKSCEFVAEKYNKLNLLAKKYGSNLKAPFMTMAFMSLLVIPELKLGDKGLFDVNKFSFTDICSNL